MEEHTEKKWLKLINPNIVELHPLQFANCERLNKHKVVYIFDEVGSGKTISSGLMALEYLEKNSNENVLVITTNALAQKKNNYENGQFLEDWFEKLPFNELKYTSRISVVNNHHSKFKTPQKYGLVIIDEAHLFLNEETNRYQNLSNNIHAEKIIFLTATPIKGNSSDLKKYIQLAENILNQKVDDSWIKDMFTYEKKPSELISSKFSLDVPVTRYFKDTIKSLSRDGFDKVNAKRYETLTWEYSSAQNKNEVLGTRLQNLYKKSSKNKSVIFTRYVEKEAYLIGATLEKFGFTKFTKKETDSPTYAIVTGANRQELSEFSSNDGRNLPTVLILTYQIAEQGINLPGFNYIINYHISSFPSALEQRYGRIDRLNSNHEKIYNCFLINSGSFDSNTFNFYSAINSCIYSLLVAIPSRNTLLSKNTLKYYIDKTDLVEKYIEGIKKRLILDNITELYFILKTKNQQFENVIHTEDCIHALSNLTLDDDLQELLNFANENQIDVDLTLEDNKAIQLLKKDFNNALAEIKAYLNDSKTDKTIINELLAKDDSLWDQIFYCKTRKIDVGNFSKSDLYTADAMEDCAKTIEESQEYVHYLANFNSSIRLPLEFNTCRTRLNKFFEKEFKISNFNNLFPYINNKLYLDVIPEPERLSPMVKENINILIPTLPFFKMINQFKNELVRSNITENRTKYKDNFRSYEHPFANAMQRLTRLNLTISDDFYKHFFNLADKTKISRYHPKFNEFFRIETISGKIAVASPWLKLTYHLTRKESLKCLLQEYYTDDFKRRAALISIYNTSEYPNYNGKIENRKFVTSLFSYMIFRNSGTARPWATYLLKPNLCYYSYALKDDYWTQAIMNNLFNANFCLKKYYL